MKYDSLPHLTLPRIGFGTWKIGGGSFADPKTDSVSMRALHTAIETGYTHFDTAEMYANGHSEELLGRAVRESQVRREAFFITTKVTPSHLRYDDVLSACENSLRRLQMDTIDLYLIHWPGAGAKYEDTFRALNKLVRDGKVKHLGVSNFNLKQLKQSQELSETPIITNQVPYSLSDRSYVKNGMLEYCQRYDIFLTAYSPIEEGNLKKSRALENIAKAHDATTYQIALAWVISQPRVITIPMSANPQHIRENFEAADIELTQTEIEQLNNA
ncbi:MAG: aldo/keto reductase [Anaerolineales bacterium]|jgi:diketogulonate reductase-like aldo/keto reductase|nr:aldo/keto reductase [Anaerolineales bacterium]